MASNPTCSAILALSASNTPGKTIILFLSSSCSRREGGFCIYVKKLCNIIMLLVMIHRPSARRYQFHEVARRIVKIQRLCRLLPIDFKLYRNAVLHKALLPLFVIVCFYFKRKMDAAVVRPMRRQSVV